MSAEHSEMEQAYAAGRVVGEGIAGSDEAGKAANYWRDGARCLAAEIGMPATELLDKVLAFHQERLDAVPDLTVYPELRGETPAYLDESEIVSFA